MVIPGKIAPPLKAQRVQDRGHRAPAGGQNYPHQQDLHLALGACVKERREGKQQRDNGVRQAKQAGTMNQITTRGSSCPACRTPTSSCTQSRLDGVETINMTSNLNDDLLKRVQTIRVATPHGRRAPHKPLLLLLSIGRYFNKHDRFVAFVDLEEDLNMLIQQFGLPNSRENADLPFWHLRNDGLWEIDRPKLVREIGGHARISDLREHGIRGGLAQDVLSVLETDPYLAWRIVQSLLDDFFPPSLHEAILLNVNLADKMGLGTLTGTKSRNGGRDRDFREVVLRVYKSRCALCKLDVQVAGQPIGLEAAHIKWHSAGGPAQIANGMALCALHHQFFDRGLFTVLSNFTVKVSELAAGNSVKESLSKYRELVLPGLPDHPDQRPASKFLEWHKQAVFQAK